MGVVFDLRCVPLDVLAVSKLISHRERPFKSRKQLLRNF
jgi:hypothetical protein